MKLLFSQVDLWLGRLVAAVMVPLLYLCIFAFSLLMFFAIGFGIFEYEIGLADVDRLEFLLVTLVLFTSYRLFYRGRKEGWDYWRLIKRFSFVTAIVILIDVFIFNLILTVLLVEKGKVMVATLYQYQDAQFFIAGGVLVLALYAAAPLPPLFKSKVVPNESGEEVPEVDVAEQEEKDHVDPWSGQSGAQEEQVSKGV